MVGQTQTLQQQMDQALSLCQQPMKTRMTTLAHRWVAQTRLKMLAMPEHAAATPTERNQVNRHCSRLPKAVLFFPGQ
jgi:hypothetical protein